MYFSIDFFPWLVGELASQFSLQHWMLADPCNTIFIACPQLERGAEQIHEEREHSHSVGHQLQSDLGEQPRMHRDPPQSSPHCLVCNAKLGVSARGAMEVFSEKVGAAFLVSLQVL